MKSLDLRGVEEDVNDFHRRKFDGHIKALEDAVKEVLSPHMDEASAIQFAENYRGQSVFYILTHRRGTGNYEHSIPRKTLLHLLTDIVGEENMKPVQRTEQKFFDFMRKK